MAVILEMKNIVKEFGNSKALDNVNFSVSEGETMAIISTSGSGKSTQLEIGRASCRERV